MFYPFRQRRWVVNFSIIWYLYLRYLLGYIPKRSVVSSSHWGDKPGKWPDRFWLVSPQRDISLCMGSCWKAALRDFCPECWLFAKHLWTRWLRWTSYFYYLSGVNEEDCYLTYDIERHHSTLYIPPITVEGVSAFVSNTIDNSGLKIRCIQVVWFGKGPTIKEAEEKSVQIYHGILLAGWSIDLDMTSMRWCWHRPCPTRSNTGFEWTLRRRYIYYVRVSPCVKSSTLP